MQSTENTNFSPETQLSLGEGFHRKLYSAQNNIIEQNSLTLCRSSAI